MFAVEPLPVDSPMWKLPNVLISPHSAGTVSAENGRIVDIFLDNLGRFHENRPLRNRLRRNAAVESCTMLGRTGGCRTASE